MATTTQTQTRTHGTSTHISVLTISLSKYLTGHAIKTVIANDWQKHQDRADSFDNIGFDVDGNDFETALEDLSETLDQRSWNGVVVGWCLRGYAERTVMFERVVAACMTAARSNPKLKIVFCTGPDDIAAATLRNFP